FQTSSSRQSWALMWAAKSLFGHVGIVEVGKDGTFVLEAISRVSRTPLAQWKARGRFGRYAVFRVSGLSPVQREAVVAHARHYLGRRYDIYFTAKNDELYCSELAEKAYEEAGVPIGKFQKAGELDVDNFLVRALMRSRWQGHPLCHGRVKTFEACWDL
ncbi:YiiX/YebB-like N1pC/P60 family cysteine hydrolase, partial [Klebsiella pneumoniae]|uniref:YiiX/YebB-like N1pC/P60 family cysteine hydrolase n=1 Tax=Klebsiella pneumoniae TaxID=573 RepID=UPI00273A1802